MVGAEAEGAVGEGVEAGVGPEEEEALPAHSLDGARDALAL